MFAVLAVDNQWGLAKSQPNSQPKMPWHSQADFQIFRALTLGHICLVSKSTYYSLPTAVKSNPKRTFKLLASFPIVANEYSFSQIKCLPKKFIKDWALIGGLKAYHQLMSSCQYAYVTTIQSNYKCNFKLDPSCLSHFESTVRLLDYTPVDQSQPSISLDVYFTGRWKTPKPLIQTLDQLRANSKSA